MSDVTPHLGLPLIAAGQAQKHVTHNEALAQLDALVQLACLDKDLSAPPASPAEGDRYLVMASAPTGAWVGLGSQVVRFTDGVWVGAVPAAGWVAYIADEKALYVFDGQGWGRFAAGSTNTTLDTLGINTQGDPTNRLAVKADAALFAWDDVTPGSGDMRLTLNKKAAARDAGFVFQTGWSTRALFGTLGGDDFVLKTSPDGAAFATALTAAAATGIVTFAASPLAPTPAAADNSTRLATTAYVDRAVSGASGGSGSPGQTRKAVADANYTVQATDRTVAVTAITAARTLTLPAASAFPTGATLTVVDESGACTPARTITVQRAGGDTVNGLSAVALSAPYAFLALQSDGTSRWTVVSRLPLQNRSTFVDVSYTKDRAAGTWFSRIMMDVVSADPGQNWDSTNSWYVCPRSGIYQISASLRLVDNTSPGTQYGLGVYTAEADGPWFLWHAVGASPATRSTFAYSRTTSQNAGDKLRMYTFADASQTRIGTSALQIILIAEAA